MVFRRSGFDISVGVKSWVSYVYLLLLKFKSKSHKNKDPV